MTTRPLKYTTTIPAKRTASECVHLLAESGADAVAVQYRDKQPVGLSFQLDTTNGWCNFALPVNVDGVQAVLAKMLRDNPPKGTGTAERTRMASRDHALNVAWRVVHDWLAAQLAIIAAGMVSLDEVMIPYLQVAPGETVRDRWLTGRLAIKGAEE